MPLPNPSSYTNKDDYISACMSKQQSENKPHDQKLAICFSEWKRKNESDIIDRINLFLSDETTTGAVATNTSGVGYPIKRKKKKKNEYKVTESARSPKKGDRFEYKGKKLTIIDVGSGMGIDKYITVQFDNEKHKRDIQMKNFFKGNEFKYIKEGYIYVIHKKKNKEMKIPDDPRVIKKYRQRGYEIKESIYGATLTSTGIAGSGQTRAVGEYSEILNLKKPVRFDPSTGTFVPVLELPDIDEAVSHKHSKKEMDAYYKRVKQLQNSGRTSDAAAETARSELKKGMFRKKGIRNK